MELMSRACAEAGACHFPFAAFPPSVRLALVIAVAAAASLFPSHLAAAPADDAIRPFRIEIPEAQLVDLRLTRRLHKLIAETCHLIQDENQYLRLQIVMLEHYIEELRKRNDAGSKDD